MSLHELLPSKVQAAFVGSAVSAFCYSYTKPKWRVEVSVTDVRYMIKKKVIKCAKVRIYLHELHIANVSMIHTGEYICRGTQKSDDFFEASFFLYVGGKLKWSVELNPSIRSI